MDFNQAVSQIPGGMDTVVYGGGALLLAGLGWLAKKTKAKWDDKVIALFQKILPTLRRK